MGRPSKGDRTGVLVRFPADILFDVERLALTGGQERHDVILQLIRKGLEADGQGIDRK